MVGVAGGPGGVRGGRGARAAAARRPSTNSPQPNLVRNPSFRRAYDHTEHEKPCGWFGGGGARKRARVTGKHERRERKRKARDFVERRRRSSSRPGSQQGVPGRFARLCACLTPRFGAASSPAVSMPAPVEAIPVGDEYEGDEAAVAVEIQRVVRGASGRRLASVCVTSAGVTPHNEPGEIPMARVRFG